MTSSLGKWWKNSPRRFLNECEKLDQLRQEWDGLFKKHEWVELQNGQLSLHGELVFGDQTKIFDLIFPHLYPSECPTIYPYPRGEKWSLHQFGGDGALCLEYGPDNWESCFNAADLISSLIRLVVAEKLVEDKVFSEEVIPSRHVVTQIEYIRSKYYRFISTPTFVALLPKLQSLDQWKAGFFWPAESCTIVPLEIAGQNISDNLPKVINDKCRNHNGICLRLDDDCETDLLRSLKSLEDINFLLEKKSAAKIRIGETSKFTKEEIADYTPVLIVSKENNYIISILRNTPNKGLYLMPAGVIETDFRSNQPRISKEIAGAVKNKKVGIIGLGSVGSKVAVSLARSGIKSFVLVDDDFLLPENVCRNELNLMHVGGSKIDQVAMSIQSVCDSTNIAKHELRLGAQGNTDSHNKALEELRTCSLLIDCTASPNCFLISSMICSQNNIPLLWGEVYAGGIGGLVARSSPIVDPCPICVRRAFIQHLSNYPPAPDKAYRDYGLQSESGEITVADDADVTFTASVLSKRAIACLTQDTSSESLFLYGLKKAWIFDGLMHVIKLTADKNVWNCADCWKPFASEKELSEDENIKFKKISEQIKNDQTSNPA